MNVTYTPADLIAFEQEIADLFVAKGIHSPIHLSGGNEEQLIDLFKRFVSPGDWICCTWRAHYHCLLKGVPRKRLLEAIVAGHSIALCFPEYRIISSAIVGGMAPIAVGLAMGIKRKREQHQRRVFCFLGDMAASTGIAHESIKYSHHHSLPLQWIVEDNGLSVCTDTGAVWNGSTRDYGNVFRYKYEATWPHCGVGKHVQF